MPEAENTLTKLTVNLTPGAWRALNRAADIGGHAKTDIVNRALQIYAVVVDEAASAPVKGTGFNTFVVDDLLGDGVAYDVWIRRAK